MKITRTTEPTRAERTAPNAGSATRSSGTATQRASSDQGRVQLSDLSSRLNQLETQFSGSSFDAAKVSEIKSAISEGRYQINAGAVADKLLESATQLASRRP
jgi:negative regulator of flagellin synthesis FlgM